MAATYPEEITARIIERLKGIRVARGYTFDAQVQEADTRLGNSPHDGLVVLDSDDASPQETGPLQRQDWHKTYRVRAYVVLADASSSKIEARAERHASDVYRAVVGTDYQLDGLVINILPQDISRLSDETGAFGGREVPFTVHYRTLQSDPSTQG